jgi:hypothetical protein
MAVARDPYATTAMQAEHQLALHSSSGVVISYDSHFECLIAFDVCQATTTPLASFGFRNRCS